MDLVISKEKCYDDDELAKWCRLFTARSEEEFKIRMAGLKMDSETNKNLIEEVKKISDDEDYFELYTDLSHHELSYNTAMEEIEQYKNDLKRQQEIIEEKKQALKEEKQNLKEEKEKIIKESMKQGKNQGVKENTLKIAKEMLKNGMKKVEIHKITGLSLNEIENLKNN